MQKAHQLNLAGLTFKGTHFIVLLADHHILFDYLIKVVLNGLIVGL